MCLYFKLFSSWCSSTLCSAHTCFWCFSSLMENGIYNYVHKYMINMACSIQNPSILSVALSIPCKYLNSCLKWVLQDLTTRMTSFSIGIFVRSYVRFCTSWNNLYCFLCGLCFTLFTLFFQISEQPFTKGN